MNKKQFIELVNSRLQKELNLDDKESRRISKDCIEVFFGSIRQATVNGEKVGIRGLGSFKTKQYKAYIGRNPKSGQSIAVPAKKMPVFSVSKDLIKFINKKLGNSLKSQKK